VVGKFPTSVTALVNRIPEKNCHHHAGSIDSCQYGSQLKSPGPQIQRSPAVQFTSPNIPPLD
jgi:hypothetical protein